MNEMELPDRINRDYPLTEKVNSVQSPTEFDHDYDSAVDNLEGALLSAAAEAMSQLNIDSVLENLTEAKRVRRNYLNLLDRCAADPVHPLTSEISSLRDYATHMDILREHMQAVWEALKEYTQGRGVEALRRLDQASTLTATEGPSSSFLYSQLRVTTENVSGMIRRGAMDYAGARAAFDRAAATAQDYSETLSGQSENNEDDEDILALFSYLQHASEAYSYHMQYEQQINWGDYVSAAESADAANSSYLEAASCADRHIPVIANFLRASSFEALALRDIANATIQLEQGNWEATSGLIKSIQAHYQTASRVSLRSRHPAASAMQERFLNSGSSWVTRFRRQMDREQKHRARIEELQLELRNLYGSVCNALGPAGIVVNNATEMVTSVKQQVEVVSRVEINIRSLLREVPDALDQSDMPPQEIEELSAEAVRLAEEESDQATFFSRVRNFAEGLATALGKGVELATPVVALLKSLSIVK
ncbi:hypothetical protein [Streptomyces sp. NPDC127119]|uniref:hypothetical protein n=1 Tax=Streptomyces sp. NPDC127119 TaxID=3345370 RepID=UPI0036358352